MAHICDPRDRDMEVSSQMMLLRTKLGYVLVTV